MTQEEKSLLLKDLCARLPYGVKAKVDGHFNSLQILGISKLYKSTWAWKKGTYVVSFWNDTKPIESIKPYLRSMSSMTEEEREELEHLSDEYFGKALDKQIQESFTLSNRDESKILEYIASSVIIDWLNAHHFDYRGLIEKGLALEAKEGIYETE